MRPTSRFAARWVYLYRAVDARGKTIDFRLSPKRDVAAAKAFFRKAFKTQGCVPRTITLDGYQASHRAVRELCAEHRALRTIKVRSCQYLNNIVEQDHRNINARVQPMLGFKQFDDVSGTGQQMAQVVNGLLSDDMEGPTIHVAHIVSHTGDWKHRNDVEALAQGREYRVQFHDAIRVENGRTYSANSDVLYPLSWFCCQPRGLSICRAPGLC